MRAAIARPRCWLSGFPRPLPLVDRDRLDAGTLLFDGGYELAWGNVQDLRDREDAVERRLSQAAFEERDSGGVQVRAVSEFLLR